MALRRRSAAASGAGSGACPGAGTSLRRSGVPDVRVTSPGYRVPTLRRRGTSRPRSGSVRALDRGVNDGEGRPHRRGRPPLPLRARRAPRPVRRRARRRPPGRGRRPRRGGAEVPRLAHRPARRGPRRGRRRRPGLRGICCDREVGGVNPAAVETALRLGARVVWLPTLSSRQDQRNGVGPRLGIPGPGLVVCDDGGELLPETREVLDLVHEHDAVLATGHVGWEEHVAVARAFGRRGRLLVTHAMEELAGPNLLVEQCLTLAGLGAHVELCALTCVGALATRSPAALAACARTVGVERVTLATDYGQASNPPPAEGFAGFADALLGAGLTEREIRRMACTNPCALLGLDG
ncbi:MAG: DUF6282 family protein [Acidimicrobiia bacterium]|nr:DUF6282 family protein [Acidimicrobiia bacterium]